MATSNNEIHIDLDIILSLDNVCFPKHHGNTCGHRRGCETLGRHLLRPTPATDGGLVPARAWATDDEAHWCPDFGVSATICFSATKPPSAVLDVAVGMPVCTVGLPPLAAAAYMLWPVPRPVVTDDSLHLRQGAHNETPSGDQNSLWPAKPPIYVWAGQEWPWLWQLIHSYTFGLQTSTRWLPWE